jgi:hypothetical protein
MGFLKIDSERDVMMADQTARDQEVDYNKEKTRDAKRREARRERGSTTVVEAYSETARWLAGWLAWCGPQMQC